MKQQKKTMSYLHWRAMVDAAENVGLEGQAIIIKISNILENELTDDDLPHPTITIELWEREIKELITTVLQGKMFNPDGDRYVQEAIKILEET